MSPLPTPDFAGKKNRLRGLLEAYGRLLVAFSGGKDSFFLLQSAREVLGAANVLPYFVTTPFTLAAARERVDYFCDRFSISLNEIGIDLLKDPRLRDNPRQRCFYCKMKIFSAHKKEGRRLGIQVIADGTTVSDLDEHRPGRAALAKLAVHSPLRDAGFSSAEIAGQLKKQGVAPYFLTSSTCLATRFPYGLRLRPRLIQAIGRIEHHLIQGGVYPLRVRYMTDGVRIETAPNNFLKLIAQKDELAAVCREEGFAFVTLDLGGMRSGCWDGPPISAKSGKS
jgi:uncharacterized protein